MDIIKRIEDLAPDKIDWEKTSGDNIDLDYSVVFPKELADDIFKNLEETVSYYEGDLTKVYICGKIQNIPRQQVAYGVPAVTYEFSRIILPALPWTDVLESIRDFLFKVTKVKFNFVLVNRYRNGYDCIGEHRDAEPCLDQNAPIASISFGETRDFILKHEKTRKKTAEIPLVNIGLKHGSILLMNPPTNKFWYHSLPRRRRSTGVRINLTFRKINM